MDAHVERRDPPVHPRRIHWHIAFTHFPLSLFGTAFLFQVLHLFMFAEAFELATEVCIVAGAASLIPAIVTGWLTWKRYYHASRARIFRRKIVIAFIMLGVSIPQAAWRIALYYLGSDAQGVAHYLFFVITTGLIAAAVMEGYYGGRLAHH